MENTPRYPNDNLGGESDVERFESVAAHNLARFNETMLDYVRSKPITAIAIAAGIGFILARAFGRRK